ncbi:MAG: hypothetical protein AB7F99_04750, partial [Vicinamibacterales bacterium]
LAPDGLVMLKRRYLYVLIFAVPALLVALIGAATMVAAVAGGLWIWAFGDNPWPPVADTILGTVLVVSGGGIWLLLLSLAYMLGKEQESRPALNMRHVAISVGATAVLAALIAIRVTGVSLTGERSDSLVCSDFCQAEGFAGSGMPPADSGDRTCSCYDAQGQEARRIDLSDPSNDPSR